MSCHRARIASVAGFKPWASVLRVIMPRLAYGLQDRQVTWFDKTDGYDNGGHLHCGAIFSNSENIHNNFVQVHLTGRP
jgi:hypothetical protein